MPVFKRTIMTVAAIAATGLAIATALRAQSKAPVYVIIDVAEMIDADAMAKATAGAPKLPEGGRYIVRTNKATQLDGGAAPSRFVIVEFNSEATMRAWKQEVKAIDEVRLKATKSRSFMVEGLSN